ncbi:PREDICTED: T-cell immunoglobulin and mucin domain-containing protein 4-like [Haliaeetus leucocephalus]|uniref:T-cell immunoglobulin and mucin domain-containing protein 4-like n=1 Tax=Haliaeetus leucocephalus TaxID=52644 RepID=UPI00053CDAC1|nr:PREDICTED: T-cell immunoglobulin and mucin domain-containing protein 4-like [Haliaeetus leucocephalus]
MSSYFCMNWILLILFTGPTVSGSLVKGRVGQNITVPCSYTVNRIQDITSMCWGRDSCPVSKCYRTIIWTDGWKVTERYNSRYMLKGNLLRGDVSLTIVNAEEADSGIYCCRVEIAGWFNDQTSNHKVVIEKARISTASPHTYTSEQTSAQGSTSESSFTITRTWPSVSASEAPQTASGPCSSTSDCSDVTANVQNVSVSLPSQQYSENSLYIGIGLCAVLLAILILALFLARQYLYNTKKTGDFANFVAFWRPEAAGNHSALEDEIHAEENVGKKQLWYIKSGNGETRLQWRSLSISGKRKIQFSLLPLAALESPSAKMSHFVLFHWIMIQILIAHTASEAVVRGVIGQPVQLPCFYQVSRQKDISDMCWGRGPCPNSKCSNKILHTTGNRVTFRKSQRYSLRGYISYGDVSLTIGKVKAEDAGIYCCRVEIPGWFNDIKRNMRLEVVRAPPVMTTTTRKAPVSPKHFRKTTLAPKATSDHQTTAETAVLLTTTIPKATTETSDHQTTAETAVLLTTTIPKATTETSDHQTTAETAVLLTTTVPEATIATTESPAVITLETIDPPTFAVTENYTIPATVKTTSALPDFPTDFQEADMKTEDDDVFCTAESVPLPGVTTKLPSTLPTAEGTKSAHTSLTVEGMPTTASSDSNAEKRDVNRDKFPSYAILIACLLAVSILFILMLSLLFWKRKHTKKFMIKSLGRAEDLEKVFSGAEGENSVFSL